MLEVLSEIRADIKKEKDHSLIIKKIKRSIYLFGTHKELCLYGGLIQEKLGNYEDSINFYLQCNEFFDCKQFLKRSSLKYGYLTIEKLGIKALRNSFELVFEDDVDNIEANILLEDFGKFSAIWEFLKNKYSKYMNSFLNDPFSLNEQECRFRKNENPINAILRNELFEEIDYSEIILFLSIIYISARFLNYTLEVIDQNKTFGEKTGTINFLKGFIHLSRGEKEKAWKFLDQSDSEEWNKYAKQKVEALILEAKKLIVHSNLSKAITIINEGLLTYPNSIDLKVIRSFINRSKGNFEESLKDLDNSLEIASKCNDEEERNSKTLHIKMQVALTFAMMSQLHESRGEFQMAESLLTKAVEYDSNNEEILISLADIYLKSKKYTKGAKAIFLSMKSLISDSFSEKNFQTFKIEDIYSDEPLEKQILMKCIELNWPKIKQKGMKANEEVYRDSIFIKLPNILAHMAQEESKTLEYSKSLIDLSEKINPNLISVSIVKARISLEMEEFSKANEAYERVLLIDPKNEEALLFLSKLNNP